MDRPRRQGEPPETICLRAPLGVLRTGADLRALILKYDRRPAGSPPMVLRLFDDAAAGYVLMRDEQPLPDDPKLKVALQAGPSRRTPPLQDLNESSSGALFVAADQSFLFPLEPQQRSYSAAMQPGHPTLMPPKQIQQRQAPHASLFPTKRDLPADPSLQPEPKRAALDAAAQQHLPQQTRESNRHASASALLEASSPVGNFAPSAAAPATTAGGSTAGGSLGCEATIPQEARNAGAASIRTDAAAASAAAPTAPAAPAAPTAPTAPAAGAPVASPSKKKRPPKGTAGPGPAAARAGKASAAATSRAGAAASPAKRPSSQGVEKALDPGSKAEFFVARTSVLDHPHTTLAFDDLAAAVQGVRELNEAARHQVLLKVASWL